MSDYRPPIETDPLGAIRKELLAAGWRDKARRDRRRHLGTVAVAMLLTFVTAVGTAGALGLEIPLLRDALDRIDTSLERQAGQDSAGEGDHKLRKELADIKPGQGNSTEAITFPWGGAGEHAFAAAYLNELDLVCFVVLRPTADREVTGCLSAIALTQRLDDGVAYIAGVSARESTMVIGYVAAEIEHIAVRGPQGRLSVRLTQPWKPSLPGVAPLRGFVAVVPAGIRSGDTVPSKDNDEAIDPRNYSIEAETDDGRTVIVRP